MSSPLAAPFANSDRRISIAATVGRWGWRQVAWLGLAVGLAVPVAAAIRGMPFSRSYSLEDIGHVPRGSRLGFDRFGRVAVIHDAVYAVLNDRGWVNLAEEGGKDVLSMSNVIQAPDGHSYYGARGSWGTVQVRKDGRLHPVPLVPPSAPNWVQTAAFNDLVATRQGVYFASWNGVAYWDFASQRGQLFEVPRLARLFVIGDRVYVSAHEKPLCYIDLASASLAVALPPGLDLGTVERATPLDERRSLLELTGGSLQVFDGREFRPWLPDHSSYIQGDVSVLQHLADGRIAVAVTGQGLLLFSVEGELLMALTSPQYRNVTALANREPGVLWVETEDSIDKVLYASPLSAFGQRLGLPIAWPIVTRYQDRIEVASGGKLYRAVPGNRSESTHFELEEHQPPSGAWALASWGDRMLVGNPSGLYEAGPDGTFQSVTPIRDLVHLVMTDAEHCFAIGRASIALLGWHDGQWQEVAPRIPGVANPAVVHRVGASVWIEMGGDGVARLWQANDRLHLDTIRNESWTKAAWVNVGAAGGVVVLSSLQEEPRRYYDQVTGERCEAPWLEALLNRSPFWIARMQEDGEGAIWAAHNEGLVRFTPRLGPGRDYQIDVTTFDLVNDRYPVVRLLPNNDVWVSAERSLYHVERPWIRPPPPVPAPVLVSMADALHGEELLTTPSGGVGLELPYARNSLSFRFFAGTDAWRRPPVYEYRLSESEPWTTLDGSLLSFRGLHEGSYRLQIRNAAGQAGPNQASTFAFKILPPWHRSWPAYFLFGVTGLALVAGAARWSFYLERKRHRMLEQLVNERTRQLEFAMARLGEETRKAATLAERDRLANEIHDSVQQGLTGAILQIDTTLKLPAVDSGLRARLSAVRNMLSYARQEVQHAVWDMESPLLEGTELADALRNLTAFVDARGVRIEVAVAGAAVPLGRTVNHNLLRVAQEATTNALRHAQARQIVLRLDYAPGQVTLEIADDGVGFQSSVVLQDRAGHLGLRGIQARVKKLQGQLVIESPPGQGTRIRAIVPIKVSE